MGDQCVMNSLIDIVLKSIFDYILFTMRNKSNCYCTPRFFVEQFDTVFVIARLIPLILIVIAE